MIHTHDPYPFRGHDPYLWSIPMIHTSVIANPGHVLVLFLSCTYGTGGVTLIQTKQKRAAREQRNKYKPRTETSTNQEQKQEQHLPIRHATTPTTSAATTTTTTTTTAPTTTATATPTPTTTATATATTTTISIITISTTTVTTTTATTAATTTTATATAATTTTTTTTTTSQSIGTSTTSTMSGIMIAYNRPETCLKEVWNRSETGLKHSKCLSCVPFPLLQFAFLLDSSKLCCYLGKKIVSMMSVPAFLYYFMSQIALAAIGSPFGC